MRAIVVLAAAVLAAALPPCVAAGEPPHSTRDYLMRMDGDHDGRVSRDEFVAWMVQTFDGIDTDHDHVLSGSELPEGSRAVTRVDYVKSLEATFARQDRNHDGYLDTRELAAPPR